MSWKPIIAGVDGSEQSVHAAAFAAMAAERSGAACHLVHAVPEYWTAVPPELGVNMEMLNAQTIEHARQLMTRALAPLPPALLTGMVNEVGRAPLVLGAAAERLGAGVVILGGKHHRGLGRLAGSTITQLVRLGTVPVLAHVGEVLRIHQVLAAVDLSAVALPTIRAAAEWAEAFGARLRVLHVVEPVPVVPGVSLEISDETVYKSTLEQVERQLRPAMPANADLIVRRGRAAAGIVSEARACSADLIVASSHGKDWMARLMIGSTSERLLSVLPAPVLVLPARRAESVPAGNHAAHWITAHYAA